MNGVSRVSPNTDTIQSTHSRAGLFHLSAAPNLVLSFDHALPETADLFAGAGLLFGIGRIIGTWR
jgi:hypothetical protein